MSCSPDALYFFEEAVQELHLVKRSLGPSILAQYADHFLAEWGDYLGILADLVQRLGGHFRSRMDGCKRQPQLTASVVEISTFGCFYHPVDGVDRLGPLLAARLCLGESFDASGSEELALRLMATQMVKCFSSLIGNWLNETPSLLDLFPQTSANGKETGCGRLHQLGKSQESLGGCECIDGVISGNAKPLLIAGELWSEKDAR